MADESSGAKGDPGESYHTLYRENGRTLATWLVAYGVGGPVLFLSQPAIAETIRSSGHARSIVSLFLFGVACQILPALAGKWSAWYHYLVEFEEPPDLAVRISDWIDQNTWLNVLFDLISVVTFSAASVWVLLLFT